MLKNSANRSFYIIFLIRQNMPQLLHILGHSIDEIKLGDFAGLERELAETRGSLEISTTDLADAAAYLERVSPIRAYDALLTVLDCKFRPGEDRRSKVEYYKRT